VAGIKPIASEWSGLRTPQYEREPAPNRIDSIAGKVVR